MQAFLGEGLTLSKEADRFIHDVGSLLMGFVRAFQVAERGEVMCCGVTLSQCWTLSVLDTSGPLPMSDLSQRLGIAQSTATRVVENLVRDGLLERTRDERDRRVVIIGLTAAGREMAGRLQHTYNRLLESVLGSIPPEKRGQVTESLQILLGAVNRSSGGWCCGIE